MAAGLRGRANQQIATAQTVRSIATALNTGEATYLDGIKAKTQIDVLRGILTRAQGTHNRKRIADAKEAGTTVPYDEREADREREPTQADVRYAEYPFPTFYRSHLVEAVNKMKNRTGCKQAARKMEKRIGGEGEYVRFEQDYDIEQIRDFVSRARAADAMTEWTAHTLQDFDRIRRANIHTVHELRAALRELIPHLVRPREDDPITKLIGALRGRKIPGFFPTSNPDLLERILHEAQIADGHTVLEPSAGIGHIADAVRAHADVELKLVEFNSDLIEVLAAKGYDPVHGNFLELHFPADRIVMNPPFEKGQDIDHVRHAHGMLNAGGRLVSIMSEGPFFREDSKSIAFREWLESHAGTSEKLPNDSFKGVEAFRETGVRTRLVVIHKEDT